MELQCSSSRPLRCCGVAILHTTTMHTTPLQCDAPWVRDTSPLRMVCGAMSLPDGSRCPHTTSLCRTSQHVHHAMLGYNCRVINPLVAWQSVLCRRPAPGPAYRYPLWLGCWCCVGRVAEGLKLALCVVTHGSEMCLCDQGRR